MRGAVFATGGTVGAERAEGACEAPAIQVPVSAVPESATVRANAATMAVRIMRRLLLLLLFLVAQSNWDTTPFTTGLNRTDATAVPQCHVWHSV
jgi:hypothetical protein